MPKYAKRSCEKCGDSYLPHVSNQRYCKVCSKRRKVGLADRLDDRACETCKTLFTPKNEHNKFCSLRCQNRAKYARNPYNPDTFGTGTTANRGRAQSPEHVARRVAAVAESLKTQRRTCKHCGDEFTPTLAAQKYCSGRCWQAVFRVRREARHKISVHADHYAELLARQDGKCGICGAMSGSNGRKDRLAVDHCHDTNYIRGLLCHRCNTALGLFNDDAERLKAAIQYLAAARARSSSL